MQLLHGSSNISKHTAKNALSTLISILSQKWNDQIFGNKCALFFIDFPLEEHGWALEGRGETVRVTVNSLMS